LSITGFAVLLFLAFWPTSYKVPHKQTRAGTKYWDLPTGSRIAYTLIPAKSEKKPFPVLFLQGGPGGPVYDHNIQLLLPLAEDGYDVYLYDQVGCGFSERLENIEEYSVERHEKDLEEIVKKIGAEKVILIGQSWGSMLAIQFVTDNPEKVEKLILTSPGPVLPINPGLEKIDSPDSLYLKEPAFTNHQGNKKMYHLRTRLAEYCAKAFNWKLASDNEMDDFATYLNYETGKSTVCDTSHTRNMESGSGYYCMVKTVQSFIDVADHREELRGCNVPVLIMKGQCDNIKWGYTCEYLTLFHKHTFVLVTNAGHGIGLEQLGIYVKIIREFLEK